VFCLFSALLLTGVAEKFAASERSYEPFEQTPSDAWWKLNHPFAEVLAGAPK
jgi:hypothetical protein